MSTDTLADAQTEALPAEAVQPRDRGAPVIRTIAMPADTNPAGDIFGGWLMAQMDLAAGNVAARRARGRCATISAEAMTFHSPVFVGDEVSLYARILKVGRTSIRIHVEVWRRERESEATQKVTEGIFTFVAIGPDRRPRPVPPEVAVSVSAR
ncbi:acyl-CoA thioesterase [Methylobacterium gregans]|uniref:Acyl-CoA thioester hydrolase n=1 Tax=Methylobacterium gregans TaxID=374424 RepID=A0AA37MBK4_9HYPH|nr:acyl-CoA thioesterase YciA [Methylobacterium gregans]GJD80040.1 putative acyl-CoA thioester hydrolase [Methylobacterium gregans]GLS53128.1 acyl-CoA thioesterase [Methylobacterium gregans]